jgi:GTPase SAR1 family protein
VRNEFYKDANLIMLVFDITIRRTLEGLDLWLKEATENGAADVPVVLIGNKVV